MESELDLNEAKDDRATGVPASCIGDAGPESHQISDRNKPCYRADRLARYNRTAL